MSRDRRERRDERDDEYADPKRAAEERQSSDKSAIKLPEGMKLWKLKAGRFLIGVLEYVVGKGNPFANPGQKYYERTYWCHYGIGPNGETVICNAKCFEKPCAVCEARAEMDRDPNADKETKKGLYWKERQLMMIVDLDDRKPEAMIVDVATHNFGKQLENEIQNGDEDDGFNRFFRRKGGMNLKLGVTEESMGDRKYCKVTSVQFKERKEPLDDKLYEDLPCLDDLIKPADYDRVKKMLGLSDKSRDDDDDDRPRRRHDDDDDEPRSSRRSRDDDDDDEPRGRRSRDDDDDLDVAKDDDRKSRRRDDDDEDEEKPRRRRDDEDEPRSRSSRDDDDEDEPRRKKSRDDEDDDDDRPRSRRRDDDD